MTPEQKHDAISQSAASLPSFGAIMAWLLGVPIEKWVAVAGLLFILIQAGYMVWKWRRDVRREAERIKRHDPPPVTTDNATL